MPPALLVAVFLLMAAIALIFSPMPPRVRWLNGIAFLFLSTIYFVETTGLMTLEQKQAIIRWGLIVLSFVITASIAGWKWGGMKAWRK